MRRSTTPRRPIRIGSASFSATTVAGEYIRSRGAGKSSRVGKSAATALGVTGIGTHGKRVRFSSTVDLVNALEREKAEGKAESEWLKAEVYGGRPAQIDVEVLDARVRFSHRSGPRKPRVL